MTNAINSSNGSSVNNGTGAGSVVLSFSDSDKSTLSTLLLVIPIVMAVFAILFCSFAYYLYMEFGWKIYKKIGADPSMRSKIYIYLD